MNKKLGLLGLMIFILAVLVSFSVTKSSSLTPFTNGYVDARQPESSDASSQFIDSLLDNSILDYQNDGYFSSYYQPTLQATYHALSILDAIGGLSQIDEVAISDYILNHYTENDTFIDNTALRYLDADFDQQYYPLLTYLEVTCYGVLALKILDQLALINSQEVMNFIWSCYQPVTSGFIGQPYDVNLDPKAKISTMDNIYYAIMTLDILGFNWDIHQDEKSDLINFISTSQAGNGGFFNDKDYVFDSLDTYEPGLFSSFFAMHSLKMFNMHETIRINDFKDFLASLYDSNSNSFSISEFPYYIDEANIIASAIGLELSDLVSYTGINRTKLIKFVKAGRNAFGGWSSSTNIQYHEIIDTFQVIRSLKNAGELDSFSYDDQAEIGSFILNFESHEGYSPLSHDYEAINQLHALTTSARLMNRIDELPLQYLYDSIEDVLFTFYVENGTEFGGTSGMYPDRAWFRSNPIEFATKCLHKLIPDLNSFCSIKWTSLALETLDAIYKLDDLPYDHNLHHVLNGVINSQYLSDSLSNLFGGFMNSIRMVRFSENVQTKTIFLENAYHAVRVIEQLADLLSLNQTVSEILLDANALKTYIARNIVESDEIYFQPRYGNDYEDILEHAYQALYILRALGEPDVNHIKVQNYVINHLNQDNIKYIYFSYKIAEFYEFEIDFDIGRTQSLIQAIYHEDTNNFFFDLHFDEIEPRAFAWVIEMAKNDDLNLAIQMESSVLLGDNQNIIVSLGNMVLEQLGSYATVKFHSNQVGTHAFQVQPDGSHLGSIPIPSDPSCYPVVTGTITVYDGLVMIKNKTVSFATTYKLITSYMWENMSGSMIISSNASHEFATGKFPLSLGTMTAEVYKDDVYLRTVKLNREDKTEYSEFSLTYIPLNAGDYTIELSINDGFNATEMFVGKISFEMKNGLKLNPDPDPLKNNEITLSIGLVIGFITVPATSLYIARRILSKNNSLKIK